MAVPISSDPDAPMVDRRRVSQARLETLGTFAEETGTHIVDLAGFLQKIDQDAGHQLRVVDEVSQQAHTLTQINHDMTGGLSTVAAANARALATVDGSLEALKTSSSRSQEIAGWVGHLDGALGSVQDTLHQVSRANERIAKIAKQVNILAVNARIEAARAGDAGRGFAVVAEAINALSIETSDAATDVTGSTLDLRQLITGLRDDAHSVVAGAEQVLEGSANADAALVQISQDVRAASDDTERLTAFAQSVTVAVDQLMPALDGLTTGLHTTAAQVHQANLRAEGIIDVSESAVQLAVEMGAVNADGAIIELVQDNAAQISALFEQAIDRGTITLNALFDTHYTEIPGTNPTQVVAAFTALTDDILPAVQEPIVATDPRIVFCAAVDRNGYLPTHNMAFSSFQGEDPVWNAAHSRNRRIFDDRVGLKSGQNTAPFLMQTYRRDMGGGEFVLMKDISAPIFVQGRHWGGLRMGLKAAR